MVLIVAWYFGTSRVKDLDQSTLGTSFGSSSTQSTFHFLLWSSSESFPFCRVQFLVHQSCFCFVKCGFGLGSLFIFSC